MPGESKGWCVKKLSKRMTSNADLIVAAKTQTTLMKNLDKVQRRSFHQHQFPYLSFAIRCKFGLDKKHRDALVD